MTSIGELLEHLETAAADLAFTQPAPEHAARVAAGWPSLAQAAGRALLRIPTLESSDAAGLYRGLAALAGGSPATPPSEPEAPPSGSANLAGTAALAPRSALEGIADDYARIDGLLTGQRPAVGRDVLHAEALRGHLLTPLNTLAEWTLYFAGPALSPETRVALVDLADGSRYLGRPTGSRYADLGNLTDAPRDPVLRGVAAWASATTDALTPDKLTTAGLRHTLNDLTVTTATAYYLTKAALLTGRVDPTLAAPALDALWEARNEWRIQARAFPTDLRLGALISEERNAIAGDLRETLRWAFQTRDGEWLAPSELFGRHPEAELLGYARALTTAAATVADHYADARGVLPTLPLRRRDASYRPVFPVGTDLSKVRRERWLPVAWNDQELRVQAARARLAATQAGRAVDLVNETALGRARTTSETVETVPRAMLLRTIELLDASIPPPRHKFGTIAHPGTRPAWANDRTPPQSFPDPIRDADPSDRARPDPARDAVPPGRAHPGSKQEADPPNRAHANPTRAGVPPPPAHLDPALDSVPPALPTAAAARWETAAPPASEPDGAAAATVPVARGVSR